MSERLGGRYVRKSGNAKPVLEHRTQPEQPAPDTKAPAAQAPAADKSRAENGENK